jgi:hypothetical protein
MFPMLYEETKDLTPEVYFGGDEVPPYYHLRTDEKKLMDDLLLSIRLIGCGSDCAGYIDGEGVHFHLADGDIIRVDMSKEFIFVSQPACPDGARPTAWQVFYFLQEPVRKALFIGEKDAILIEKTGATYDLCRTLDRLWAQDSFLEMIIAMADSEAAREKSLARLMKVCEEEGCGTSSEMWEFWGTFGNLLMGERLGLSVQLVSD